MNKWDTAVEQSNCIEAPAIKPTPLLDQLKGQREDHNRLYEQVQRLEVELKDLNKKYHALYNQIFGG